MFFSTIVAAAALAASAIAAPIAIEAREAAPSGYPTGYLEDYNTYHLRYIALDCQDHHNTTFFDECCHPLLAQESLSTRPSYCTPNTTEIASASSFIATEGATTTVCQAVATATTTSAAATTTGDDSLEEYCPTDEETVASSTSTSSTAAATTSSIAADNAYAHVKVSSTTTSTSQWVAPTTTSTSQWVAPTTTSSQAAATTSSSSSSSSGTVETGGYATYFYQDGVAGECGVVHSDSDFVIAIDKAWWPDYMTNSNSDLCGKSITITNTDNGKTTTAVVADVCPTCDTNNSLDLSIAAFEAIADLSSGMVPITWYFS